MTVVHEKLTEATLDIAARTLASRDRDLAAIYDTFGPPPLWARRQGFATLIQIILEQQVSLQSAASLFARLQANVIPFNPDRMLKLGELHLKSMGLTRQKAAYCLDLAQSINSKTLKLRSLERLSDDEVRAALMEVKGLGSWSADVYLLMALLRADIWPASDLALAIGVTNLKKLPARPTSNELIVVAEAWRPYRSVAARMVWQFYLAQREDARKRREH